MGKKKMPRWTTEENKALLKLIRANSDNLSRAFRLFCAEYTHRSVKSVEQHWYSYLRHNTACFVVISNSTRINSKQKCKEKNTWKARPNLLKWVLRKLGLYNKFFL